MLGTSSTSFITITILVLASRYKAYAKPCMAKVPHSVLSKKRAALDRFVNLPPLSDQAGDFISSLKRRVKERLTTNIDEKRRFICPSRPFIFHTYPLHDCDSPALCVSEVSSIVSNFKQPSPRSLYSYSSLVSAPWPVLPLAKALYLISLVVVFAAFCIVCWHLCRCHVHRPFFHRTSGLCLNLDQQP